MAVRLQKLLEKVTDQEITVLAGREGLKNPIRWVHMVEGVEISTFLEGVRWPLSPASPSPGRRN